MDRASYVSSDLTNYFLLVHGVLMTFAFGVFIPLALIVARYYKKQFKNTWLRWHTGLLSAAGIFILSGLFYSSTLNTGKTFLIDSNHSLIGYVLIFGLCLQAFWGYKIKRYQDPDLRSESTLEERHGFFGIFILGFGCFTLVTGVISMRRDPSNDQWIFFAKTISILALLVTIGFAFLEKTRGRSSRYSSGNIFKQGKTISLSGETISVTPNQLYKVKESSLFGDDAFDSPGQYRPTWKMPKSRDLSVIVPIDKHQQPKKTPSPIKTDILEKMKENEIYTPRARLSSITRINESRLRSLSTQRGTLDEGRNSSVTNQSESKLKNSVGETNVKRTLLNQDIPGPVDRLAKNFKETGDLKTGQTTKPQKK